MRFPEAQRATRRTAAASDARSCTIVIPTFNRCERLLETLARLHRCGYPNIIVVDNGSSDRTLERVRALVPSVTLVALRRNIGAAARNVGAQHARTPYVAFCDDDCWWERGSLQHATALLDAHPTVALLNARVLVRDERIDEACALMAASTLPKKTTCPGTAIAAFLAGASVIRRSAFLEAGGYDRRYHIGAEESLLAIDLLERGWELIYVEQLVVVHAPAREGRHPKARRIAVQRNRLWTSWLRHSRRRAWAATMASARRATNDAESLYALVAACAGLAWIARERRPVRPEIERFACAIVEPSS